MKDFMRKIPWRRLNGPLIFLLGLLSIVLTAIFTGGSNLSKTIHFVNGVADFSSNDISVSNDFTYVVGDVDFYYNRFMVSEEESNRDASPSRIAFPSFWYTQGYERDGYATYEFGISGITRDSKIGFQLLDPTFAYAIYAKQGDEGYQLLYQDGELSKTSSDYPTKKQLAPSFVEMKNGNTRLSIAIEVSYNHSGGISSVFAVVDSKGLSGLKYYNALLGLGAGLVIANFFLAFLMFLVYRKTKGAVGYLILAVGILVHFFGSRDAFYMISMMTLRTSAKSWMILAFVISTTVVGTAFYYYTRQRKIFRAPRFSFILGAVVLLSLILILTFAPAPYTAFSSAPIAIYTVYFLYEYGVYGKKHPFYSALFTLLFTLFGLLSLVQCLDYANAFNFPVLNYETLVMAAAGLIFNFIHFHMLRATAEQALLTAQNEKEYGLLMMQASIKQTTPHFLFNSLALVENQYRQGYESGDQALHLLKDNIEKSLSASKEELVMFNTELDTIRSFVKLMNLRREASLTLRAEIAYSSFKVPPLSLEVFVENAFKHGYPSGEGEILLRSYKSGRSVFVSISDKGQGFDSSKPISSGHTGVSNAKFRISHTLNGEVVIKSMPGKGTTVLIKIPLQEEIEL